MVLSSLAGDTIPSKPVFTEVPMDQRSRLSQRLSLSCIASGNTQPRIQWYKDGVQLHERAGNILLFEEVQVSDRGFYHCTATNAVDEVTSDIAIISLTDIVQYVVPLEITIPGTGRFQDLTNASDSVIQSAIMDFVNDLNGLGQTVVIFEDSAESLAIYQIETSRIANE